MEEKNVIDNIECLWFFSNVLHSPPLVKQHIQLHFCNEDMKVDNMKKMETPSEPIVILQQPSIEVGKNEGSRSRNEKENEDDINKLHNMHTTLTSALPILHKTSIPVLSYPVHKTLASAEVDERKSRKLLKKRNRKSVNVGDYNEDLGFDFSFDLSKFWYERLKLQNENRMMPPLSDGMAMKQHLKSWAYAVACNVR